MCFQAGMCFANALADPYSKSANNPTTSPCCFYLYLAKSLQVNATLGRFQKIPMLPSQRGEGGEGFKGPKNM